MTVTNRPLEWMDNGRESVALSAIMDAVVWRDALENTSDPSYLRRGQRVTVYPEFLTKFATVMLTGNVGLHMDGGHDIACERILAECQTWAANCGPLFSPEDSSELGRWSVLAEKASIWMEEARQIAVAGYRPVLEDGPDVCDSENSPTPAGE
jgi:hypothetical protein